MAELDGVTAGSRDLEALALVNYGHFTSMRVDDGRVRGLALHMERLTRDCQAVFGVPLDTDRVRELARRTVSSGGSSVIRVTVYDPELELGRPGVSAEPRVLVTVRPAAVLPMAPIRVRSVRFAREMPEIKHVGLFAALCHRREAQLAGYDDALFTMADGRISEGGTWNFGCFDGARVIWADAPCLPGVTMELLKQQHAQTAVEPVGPVELAGMEAVFATNAAIGVRVISAIGDTSYANEHPVIDLLRKEYQDIEPELL